MKVHFYSHLLSIDSLKVALEELDMEVKDREHLLSLAQDHMHHTILDAILSELSEDDKRLFLSHIATEKHDKVWSLLSKRIDNIEKKIQETADDVTKKLHEDIKEVKKRT